jgi:hypothetical protein
VYVTDLWVKVCTYVHRIQSLKLAVCSSGSIFKSYLGSESTHSVNYPLLYEISEKTADSLLRLH